MFLVCLSLGEVFPLLQCSVAGLPLGYRALVCLLHLKHGTLLKTEAVNSLPLSHCLPGPL